MSLDWVSRPEALGRFLVTSFFAIVFLQSALDKWVDRDGNLGYFREHFQKSPFLAQMVPLLFWGLTLMETAAGVLCAAGVLLGSFRHPGANIAAAGVTCAGLSLLALILGQRLAKDYAGAAVVAAYFAVALIGVALF